MKNKAIKADMRFRVKHGMTFATTQSEATGLPNIFFLIAANLGTKQKGMIVA